MDKDWLAASYWSFFLKNTYLLLKYFFSPFKVVGSEGSYENKSLSYQSVQTVQSNTGHYDLSNYLISHILSATKRNFISDLSKSAWQRQWRSNLRNPWTSPVVEWSWPSFQPREWNNISQDFFLWPCFDLLIDLDAWISSPCLYLESIWKPDDIGFVWVRWISPIVHVSTVTLEMQNTNIFLTVLNVLIIQRHGNRPETLFRLPVSHSSQLYKRRYYNLWEGTAN